MKLFLVGGMVSALFSLALIIYSTFFIPLRQTQLGFTNDGLELSQWTLMMSMLFMILYQGSNKK